MHACARLWLWQVPLASSPIPTIVDALCDEHDNPTSHTIFKSEQACHTLGLVVELDLVDDLVILGATPPHCSSNNRDSRDSMHEQHLLAEKHRYPALSRPLRLSCVRAHCGTVLETSDESYRICLNAKMDACVRSCFFKTCSFEPSPITLS